MKTQKLAFVISAALFAAAAPRLAYAGDPTTAEGWYTEGSNQYDLQNWDKAIDAFKKGAELEPDATKKSAYLYNIGQAYGQRKQPGDCTKAVFFYKRYLDLRDQPGSKPLSPEKRKAAEDKIAELEQCAKDEGKATPPKDPKGPVTPPPKDPKTGPVTPPPNTGKGNTTPPKDPKVGEPTGNGNGTGEGEGEGEGEGGGGIHKGYNPDAPKLLSARLLGGVSKVSTGQISNPVHAGFALIGGYPLAINEKLSLELGAAVNYTPLLYQVAGMSKTGSVTGVMANAGASYELIPKLAARVDVGVGGMLMAGVSESPYTMGQPTTGALTMFTVRAGVSVDYAVTPNILATVMPFAFEFSPAKSGLRDDIKNITRFDFMVGVGYRM